MSATKRVSGTVIFITVAASLLLGTVTCRAQGIEWETLNSELMTLFKAGKYENAAVVSRKALDVAEQNVGK